MIYGLLDQRSSILRLVQAGHPHPVLISAEGDLHILGEGGMPVGLMPDIQFDCVEVPFKKGDRLVLYSDGVIECSNPEGEQFGEEKLLNYLSATTHQPLQTVLGGLEHEMEKWRGSTDFEDDVSLLALELSEEGV
jgi:sigma-B regulation protein RsbU (phosphoserine phosphatase)